MAKVKEKVVRRVGEIVRPDREFSELRDIAERRRSPTWQITIALIAATIGAAALGYLAVQLYFLPETIRESRLNRVPDLTSMGLDDAAEKGEGSGYVVAVAGRDYSTDVDEGEVIYQDPPPDMYLPRGDTLRVLVSLGEPDERIPDVAGLELDLARQVLGRMDLRVSAVRREASDVHPQGTVIRTEPAARTSLEELEDRVLAIVLSRGGSRLTMPDVRNLTLAQARDTLEVYSLTVGQVANLVPGDTVNQGGTRVVVVGQDPESGWLVPAGSAVDLTLGEAEPRRPAPAPAEQPAVPTDEAPADEAPREEQPAEVPAEEVPLPPLAPPDTSP